ncbi:conserved Plasmodium protein, unknown function [Plasmodium yoelii]|uniref:Uncharacterized protein n=2 Tax=Plasmodium yoelii TaxID=5861 RepID=A0AAF0B2E9_PLAYO|nr:conserved Plasmodium protein, unknown function [Plasmodium yoelii]WBY59922.1 hypothetical protein Py17XNL_001303107 [Plasmodium yoelii yoelii]CDU19866.1 conserved Plasmodium protein, unknown function [Plasmodium yoelii]VTZ80623.1 conserved Plasmodium protein, unknown function [Plasmodium yoelii]|eukprot:XP_727809.2 conserved Plasmodium protein, unknown function [Plasmodium yoelii]
MINVYNGNKNMNENEINTKNPRMSYYSYQNMINNKNNLKATKNKDVDIVQKEDIEKKKYESQFFNNNNNGNRNNYYHRNYKTVDEINYSKNNIQQTSYDEIISKGVYEYQKHFVQTNNKNHNNFQTNIYNINEKDNISSNIDKSLYYSKSKWGSVDEEPRSCETIKNDLDNDNSSSDIKNGLNPLIKQNNDTIRSFTMSEEQNNIENGKQKCVQIDYEKGTIYDSQQSLLDNDQMQFHGVSQNTININSDQNISEIFKNYMSASGEHRIPIENNNYSGEYKRGQVLYKNVRNNKDNISTDDHNITSEYKNNNPMFNVNAKNSDYYPYQYNSYENGVLSSTSEIVHKSFSQNEWDNFNRHKGHNSDINNQNFSMKCGNKISNLYSYGQNNMHKNEELNYLSEQEQTEENADVGEMTKTEIQSTEGNIDNIQNVRSIYNLSNINHNNLKINSMHDNFSHLNDHNVYMPNDNMRTIIENKKEVTNHGLITVKVLDQKISGKCSEDEKMRFIQNFNSTNRHVLNKDTYYSPDNTTAAKNNDNNQNYYDKNYQCVKMIRGNDNSLSRCNIMQNTKYDFLKTDSAFALNLEQNSKIENATHSKDILSNTHANRASIDANDVINKYKGGKEHLSKYLQDQYNLNEIKDCLPEPTLYTDQNFDVPNIIQGLTRENKNGVITNCNHDTIIEYNNKWRVVNGKRFSISPNEHIKSVENSAKNFEQYLDKKNKDTIKMLRNCKFNSMTGKLTINPIKEEDNIKDVKNKVFDYHDIKNSYPVHYNTNAKNEKEKSEHKLIKKQSIPLCGGYHLKHKIKEFISQKIKDCTNFSILN